MKKIVTFESKNQDTSKSYDKTLYRLITILQKLSNNEQPTSKQLSEEFGVSTRTIQKDISQRLFEFPIERTKDFKYKFLDGYSLDRTHLSNDEMILLQLSLSQFKDVTDFDKVSNNLFKKLVSSKFVNPYYVKQEDIQDIDIDSYMIELLELAITKNHHVKLLCTQKETIIEPYKITAFDGIWYLFGKDETDNKIKTFLLSHIKSVIQLSDKHSTNHKEIEKILSKTHSAWYDDGNTFKVVVKVYHQIAHFFLQKDFLQSQKILQKLSDGGLIVEFEVTHDEDIDNIIKSWLPHIEVLKPKRLRDKITNELKNYLHKLESEPMTTAS